MTPNSKARGLAVMPDQIYTGHPDLGSQVDQDTWLTPRHILMVLGPFDLDPCAATENPHWVCAQSFTEKQDGLHQPWSGRVFMNPPYSDVEPWIRRHAEHGRGISMVPTSVESKFWRELVWARAKAILLLSGRTTFCRPDGSKTIKRPLRSIALIGWNSEETAILRSAGPPGTLLTSWDRL